MKAEIITIGDEILIGQVVDTNSAWLGQQLNKEGIRINRIVSVSDNADEIKNALSDSIKRAQLVILTGGLGPTRDDITKKTLADFFNCGMVRNYEVEKQLRVFFEKRGRTLLETNLMQADVPAKCTVLHNEWGTAPGMLFNESGVVVVSMPGVPNEMKNIFTNRLLPVLQQSYRLPGIIHHTIVTANIPESMLAKQIEVVEDALPPHIKLAYLPAFNIVRLRLSARPQLDENTKQMVLDFASQIKEIIGEAVVVEKDISMAEAVIELLRSKKISLSIAESCTGGFVSHQITAIPGASDVFWGSIISYDNEIKINELQVSRQTIQSYGAVSEEVVSQMLVGIQNKYHTDCAIAISGIAGPGGGTEEKPVGTVYIGVAYGLEQEVKEWHFTGDRMSVIQRTALMAFDRLRKLVLTNSK